VIWNCRSQGEAHAAPIVIPTLAASALGCSDSVTGPAPASTNPTSALPVRPTDPTNAVPGNLGPIHLTGGGFLTEATVTGNGEVRHSWSTTVLAARSATKVGRVRGRLSFEAAGILQTFDTRGNATYTPISDRTTKIYAEFDTPLGFKLFTPPVISPP
jgi:hypothetical protein